MAFAFHGIPDLAGRKREDLDRFPRSKTAGPQAFSDAKPPLEPFCGKK